MHFQRITGIYLQCFQFRCVERRVSNGKESAIRFALYQNSYVYFLTPDHLNLLLYNIIPVVSDIIIILFPTIRIRGVQRLKYVKQSNTNKNLLHSKYTHNT